MLRRHRTATTLALLALGTTPAFAQPLDWRTRKCTLYREAWHQQIDRSGRGGLTDAFIRAHQAFLDSGCVADVAVCPRTPEELALANRMVLHAMNAGTASTFPPFGCRK